MKAIIKIEKEVEVKYVVAQMAVRYEEEDIPNDFPLRNGDTWCGTIDIDTGIIVDWPQGQSGHLAMKVCDEGRYELLDADRNSIVVSDGYVPNSLIPGNYGDYVDMIIDVTGKVTNWPKQPSLEDFFPED